MSGELDLSAIMESIDINSVLKLLGKLKEMDMNKVLDILSEIDVEKMLLLAKAISEKADSILKALETLDRLEKSGILPIIDAVAESMDENFNAIARPPIMKAAANLMILVNLLSQLDQEMLMDLSMSLPKCLEKMKEAFEKTEKGMGTFELLGAMKTPEMAAMIRALQETSKCLKRECFGGK